MCNKKLFGLLALTCLMLLGLGATCVPTTDGTGTLRVLITDKPYPFEFISEAIGKVVAVNIRQGEEGDEDESSWITVFEDAEGQNFNLIELQNGQTALLADAEVEAGTYTQLRLVISGGQVTLTDEERERLKVERD